MSKRTLIVMRHAKAAWPPGVADHARPLAPRGQLAAPLMARWLGSRFGGALSPPECVLVSDAARTRETFILLQSGLAELHGEFDRRLYNANIDDLFEVLREQGESKSVMLIAHNPGMQDLVETLADPSGSDALALTRVRHKFPTAGIAEITINGAWHDIHAGCGALRQFVTPAMLGGVDED